MIWVCNRAHSRYLRHQLALDLAVRADALKAALRIVEVTSVNLDVPLRSVIREAADEGLQVVAHALLAGCSLRAGLEYRLAVRRGFSQALAFASLFDR